MTGSLDGTTGAIGAIIVNAVLPGSSLMVLGFSVFGVNVLDGGKTSPLAIASCWRNSTSALEGRPRFFG